MLPTYVVINFMDPIIGQMLSQIEVDCISKSVWEAITWIGSSLESEDDDSNNDIFYTPLSSHLKPIFVKLENHLHVNHGKRRSCILLDYHLKIFYQVLYCELSSPLHPLWVTLKQVENGQDKSSRTNMPFIGEHLWQVM